MSRHPKIRLEIAPTCVDAVTIKDALKPKYEVKYCGIHSIDEKVFVYLHQKERLSYKIVRFLLGQILEIKEISKFSFYEGDVLDSEGEKVKHGGHNILQYGGNKKTMTTKRNNSSPPPSKKPLRDNLHDRQPVITLPKPESKISFVLNPPTHVNHPDNFHPIWSSKDGHWAPYFWVGPSKSIKVSKRVQPTSSQVERLFWLQDNCCRLCDNQVFMGTYSNADVDHIVPLNLGGETVESNLQILCVCCHRRKTSLESRKIMVRMTEPEVTLEPNTVYSINSHAFFEPFSIKPLDAKGSLGADPGMYKLFY